MEGLRMIPDRPKLLVFIVAYNAETTIKSVLTRIPASLSDEYLVEVLIIDDSSRDQTFEKGHEVGEGGTVPYPIRVLYNPLNQGYGGNQKIGYHYAIENSFDFVALLHGDGQYAPECLPELVRPLKDNKTDAVFGSRMMEPGAALKGGMPVYKYVGNKILTWFENKMLRTSLTEFHSGYRVYSVNALKRIPFHLNTKDFHFDTEIIIQLVAARLRIVELPIPTYYGNEICHVNGLKYAWHVTSAAAKARLQELSVFYDRKFDCAPGNVTNVHYVPKFEYTSSHSMAFEAIKPGDRVIELGCAGGYFGERLRTDRNCHVIGVDREPLALHVSLDKFVQHDLDAGLPDLDYKSSDVIVLLDVIEHLRSPEGFVELLSRALTPKTRVIVTSGNVAFFVTRLMLLLGQFNYGKRGILDISHTRLFTFSSLRALFEQAGFEVVRTEGIPAPYPLAIGRNLASKVLLSLNAALIRISRGLFSYQIFCEIRCNPSLGHLLSEAKANAEKKLEQRLAA
jgi:glycosyltransferase involved in cell wall biosynthesis